MTGTQLSQDSHAFRDLDNKTTLDEDIRQIESPDCEGFALQFSAAHAGSHVNLTRQFVRQLLLQRSELSQDRQCLWLNLWGWTEENQAIIQEIASHYDISPRLAHSMCPRTQTRTQQHAPNALRDAVPAGDPNEPRANLATTMADIFNAVWHFGSVDLGRRYLCLGWNALFFLPHTADYARGSKPNAVRVWSTVLLCDDGTVISVFEDPPTTQRQMLLRARHNQINIFRNLSTADTHRQSALLQTTIRASQGPEESMQVDNMAALLLYYLFDDWMNLFAQVTGSKSSYRSQLEAIRHDMMQHPRPEPIDHLHMIGRQLGALRSVCKSYRSLIEQMLRSQVTNASSDRARAERVATGGLLNQADSDGLVGRVAGVIRLPLSAIARFERLMERIDLCALTELDECIAEKESLVQMNFNLINLRNTQTLERLTRTTILLAKVTILFLPISLATGYFSMQIKAIEDTSLRTYWLTLLIVVIVTIAFLGGFEWLSSRYSGKLVYQSLTRTFVEHRRNHGKLPT